MNKRYAVMDLGTNTFHLLIVEQVGGDLKEIIHEHEPVKLGEGGINKGLILQAAFERGVKAMQQYGQLIKKNEVQQVRAIATSALRSAANGQDFIDEVKNTTGIQIEIIDGDVEADFIYKGVKAGQSLSKKNSLIVDIGGGSVEFIIGDSENIKWKQSFEIGAARLMDKFHIIDPIPAASITALNEYLEEKLQDLFAATSNYAIDNIIGSSGAFETYAEVIELDKGNSFNLAKTKHYAFIYNELVAVTDKFIMSSHQKRVAMKGIIPIRVDMIVTASLLTRFVMEMLWISNVVMSTNSLKEGVLAEMAE